MTQDAKVLRMPPRKPRAEGVAGEPGPAAAPRVKSSRIIDQALAYWQRIRANRAMPSRADLNPGDIPKLLPFIILMDVLHDPLDFRYRLIGTEIDRIVHKNYRGMRLSEIPGKEAPNPIWQHHQETVEARSPVRKELTYSGPDGDVRRIEHCLMPFSSDGKTVEQILVAVEIERQY